MSVHVEYRVRMGKGDRGRMKEKVGRWVSNEPSHCGFP